MQHQSPTDPPRLPLRIPIVVHSRTDVGTTALCGSDAVIQPGDATYDREYHFAVFALQRYAVPMPYADAAASVRTAAARTSP